MATTAAPPTHVPEYLWDSVGPAYENAFPQVQPQLDSISWILSELASEGKSRAKCLDIGSGSGRPVCKELADAGHHVLGIDVSPKMVEGAKARVPNAMFEVANIKSWSPSEAAYDVITAYFSLIANMTQDDIKGTIKKIHSWLVPGGLFVFATVPVPGNLMEIKWMSRDIIVSGLSPEEYGTCFREVGFAILKEEQSKYMPKGVEAGLTDKAEDVWEEPHLFIHARKKEGLPDTVVGGLMSAPDKRNFEYIEASNLNVDMRLSYVDPDLTIIMSPSTDALKVGTDFIDYLNTGQYDKLEEVLHPEYRKIFPPHLKKQPAALPEFLEEYKALVIQFPDVKSDILRSIASEKGDEVWLWTKVKGLPEGFEMEIVEICRLEDGKVIEKWDVHQTGRTQ